MYPNSKILELPATAEQLIELCEQAKVQGDLARAEHLLVVAWSAYDRAVVDCEDVVPVRDSFPSAA